MSPCWNSKDRCLRWLGHVERIDNSRLPKCLLVCRPEGGKHSLGGQKRRWCDVVQDDLKSCHLLADWRQAASQREAWRGVVKLAVDELNQGRKKLRKRRRRTSRRGNTAKLTPLLLVMCNGAPLSNFPKLVSLITNDRSMVQQRSKLCNASTARHHSRNRVF